MSRDLPFATPEEEGLEACSRDGYEVTERSRFEDPDAKHHLGCPCVECCFGKNGERVCYDHVQAGAKSPVADCEKCARLNAPPYERGPNLIPDDAPDYNPPKPEIWPTIRYRGQRMGVGMPVLPKCAKCGHGIRENLRETGDGFECRDGASCAAQVRANAKLRLIKGDKP